MTKKAIAAYAVYLVVLLVVMDLLAGLIYRRSSLSYGRINVSSFLGELDEKNLLNERPHPYLLWENTPHYISKKGIKQANNLGYRNSNDFSFTKGDRVLRILVLGGSTTWGFLLDGPDDAWPAQLEKLLNARLAESAKRSDIDRIEVINGGLNYGTSAELLLHYLFRDRYTDPDVVIVHTGGNDAMPLLWPGYNPEYSHFRPGWPPDAHRARKYERFFLKHSNVARLLYALWLSDDLALPHIHKQAGPWNLPQDDYTKNAMKNEPTGFERNLSLLLRNIKSDGTLPVLFPFMVISDEQFAAMKSTATNWEDYEERIRPGYMVAFPKNMEVMERLSRQSGIPLIRLDSKTIPREYFLDRCHLSREGEAIKAEFVTDRVWKLLHDHNLL